ncbi:MAG: hypothetical protein ACP5OC_07850 [Thermoplasmata archaeon]
MRTSKLYKEIREEMSVLKKLDNQVQMLDTRRRILFSICFTIAGMNSIRKVILLKISFSGSRI